MPLQFETNSGGGGTVISGTPNYLAMFNGAGDNVEDSVVFQSITGPNVNQLEVNDPNGTAKLFFCSSINVNQSSISVINDAGSVGIIASSLIYGTGAGFEIIDSATTNQLNVFIDAATGIPTIVLFDVVNTTTAKIFNDGSLKFLIGDDKTIFFNQETQSGNVSFGFGNNDAIIEASCDFGFVEIRVLEVSSVININSGSENSQINLYVANDDTETLFEMYENTVQIFKASSSGISTDGSTNTWQLGAASAGVAVVDTKIRISINGTDYDIAAEAV